MTDINITEDNAPELYYEFIEELEAKFKSFMLDAESGITNKSGGLRARKLSMQLRKDLQDFRRLSVKYDQANTKKRNNKQTDIYNNDEDIPQPGEPVKMPSDDM